MKKFTMTVCTAYDGAIPFYALENGGSFFGTDEGGTLRPFVSIDEAREYASGDGGFGSHNDFGGVDGSWTRTDSTVEVE
jgi:hypothetical protein